MGKLRCGNCYKNVEQEDLIELNEFAWKCPHCRKRILSVDKDRYIDWLESRNERLRTRLETIIKCLDGGLQGENRLRNMQLLDEVKVIAGGEREGGGE